MIQNQSKIVIKDNSGLLLGRCINARKPYASVGSRIKVAVLKAKSITKRKNESNSSRNKLLQDLVLIQTKRIIIRNDGSTVKFNENRGVCVSKGRGGKLQLGFKRINSSVALELKQSQKTNANLVKFAKGLI